jgi:phage virion morphogenesis protein
MDNPISIRVETAEIQNKLAELQALTADLTKPLEQIGADFKERVRLCFHNQADPWGRPWKPSQRALRQNGQTLRDTGRLLNSINYQAGATRVRIGTNVSYAPHLQYGYTRHIEAHRRTLYFKRDKDGGVGNKFVKKDKSDFAQDYDVPAHDIQVGGRAFLPIRNNAVLLPVAWRNSILGIINHHINQARG